MASAKAKETQYIVFMADVQVPQAAKLREALTNASNAGRDIYLFISSPGGSVNEGLNIAALMTMLPVNVITHNVGQTDSIANVIFAAGKTRYAVATSSFLFHGVSWTFEKQNLIESQIEENHKNAIRTRESIATAFATYTGLSVSDAESLMVSGATILNAVEAHNKSIIHEIRDASVPPGTEIITIGNV